MQEDGGLGEVGKAEGPRLHVRIESRVGGSRKGDKDRLGHCTRGWGRGRLSGKMVRHLEVLRPQPEQAAEKPEGEGPGRQGHWPVAYGWKWGWNGRRLGKCGLG